MARSTVARGDLIAILMDYFTSAYGEEVAARKTAKTVDKIETLGIRACGDEIVKLLEGKLAS